MYTHVTLGRHDKKSVPFATNFSPKQPEEAADPWV